MIRPTARAVLIFAAGVPLSLVLVSLRPGWWALSLDYGVLALVLIALDALLAFPNRLLAVTIEPPERILLGDPAELVVSILATAFPRRVRFALLPEQTGDLDPPLIGDLVLEPGTHARIGLKLVPHRRGRIRLERLWLRWQGPLGLVQRIRIDPIGRSVDVLQNVRGVHSAALQFFAREAVFGIKVQHERGEGTEYDSLRDHVPGLDTRFIDWKHSARHHRLVCKEFRVERSHPIILAFDTGHLMLEPIDGLPRLDHAINAGLLLGWIALRGGDLVGSFGFDATVRHWIQPVRGLGGFGRLQRATAELDYHHEETNFTLGLADLAVRLKRRALVVVFTDFVDTVTAELMVESLQRMVQRHVVIFVCLRDPFLQQAADAPPTRFEVVAEAVVADGFRRDRQAVFDRLDRLGVHCLDVPRSGLSVGLINRYLMVKQRGLI